jgi:acetyltransferase-like isoleucine patch superfamily enzyme
MQLGITPANVSFLQRLRRSLGQRYDNACAPLQRLRLNLYLAYKGVQPGQHLTLIGKLPFIKNDGLLTIGDRVVSRNPQTRSELYVSHNARLSIGADSYINQGVTIACSHCIDIGERCLIGEFVTIYDTNFHPLQPDKPVKNAPVRIGCNVWISHRATILPGVTVGDHAVIGAGAIVTKDVPAKTFVAGNPARPMRSLDCSDDWRRP